MTLTMTHRGHIQKRRQKQRNKIKFDLGDQEDWLEFNRALLLSSHTNNIFTWLKIMFCQKSKGSIAGILSRYLCVVICPCLGHGFPELQTRLEFQGT